MNPVIFRCNLCGAESCIELSKFTREGALCATCGSNARRRALIRALLTELGIEEPLLARIQPNKQLIGLGMTDPNDYADLLAEKFAYQNTFLHQEPFLDIGADDLPADLMAVHDFVISSEVLEHVTPPVDRAFRNIFKLLKPGGLLALTVPYGLQESTKEHFPELHRFEIVKEKESYRLVNLTKEGVRQEFVDLVFHGGPGSTLEMRVFSQKDLLRQLSDAGFEQIKVHTASDLSYGAFWPESWSLPITARRPSTR